MALNNKSCNLSPIPFYLKKRGRIDINSCDSVEKKHSLQHSSFFPSNSLILKSSVIFVTYIQFKNRSHNDFEKIYNKNFRLNFKEKSLLFRVLNITDHFLLVFFLK